MLDSGQDATYENQAQAKVTMWEQTIVPLILAPVASAFTNHFGIEIGYDLSNSPLAAAQTNSAWVRQDKAKDILTANERRAELGFPPIPGGDFLMIPNNVALYDTSGKLLQSGISPAEKNAEEKYLQDLVNGHFESQKHIGCDHAHGIAYDDAETESPAHLRLVKQDA